MTRSDSPNSFNSDLTFLEEAAGAVGLQLGIRPSLILRDVEEHGIFDLLLDVKIISELLPNSDGSLSSELDLEYKKYGLKKRVRKKPKN